MTKKLILLGILLLVSVPAFGQWVDSCWIRTYNGPGNSIDEANAIVVAGANICVTGKGYSGTSTDFVTLVYGLAGNLLWGPKYYNGPGNSTDEAAAMAKDNSGNLYVTGGSIGIGTYFDYATIKYRPNGDTAWVRRYNGDGNGEDFATDIAVDGSGNVYITGFSLGNGTNHDYYTIKYDSSGTPLWADRYNGPGNSADSATAVAVDANGNVWVTGASIGTGSGYDYFTIKYSSTGQVVCSHRYNGPGNYVDKAYDIAVDGSNNAFVTGGSYGAYYPDYATIKYSSNCDTLWVRRYDGSAGQEDEGRALVVDGSGNVYVTGYSYGTNTSFDFATIKYLSNGDTAWVRRYNRPGYSDIPSAMAIDPHRNVYVTGYSYFGSVVGDYTTVKYDQDGNQGWYQLYNGPADKLDQSRGIAVYGSGSVFVTGVIDDGKTSLNSDYGTIKYFQYKCGDTNGDGNVSSSDIVFLINYLYKGGPAPCPLEAGDPNCDGYVNSEDVTYLVNYLYKFGPAPCDPDGDGVQDCYVY